MMPNPAEITSPAEYLFTKNPLLDKFSDRLGLPPHAIDFKEYKAPLPAARADMRCDLRPDASETDIVRFNYGITPGGNGHDYDIAGYRLESIVVGAMCIMDGKGTDHFDPTVDENAYIPLLRKTSGGDGKLRYVRITADEAIVLMQQANAWLRKHPQSWINTFGVESKAGRVKTVKQLKEHLSVATELFAETGLSAETVRFGERYLPDDVGVRLRGKIESKFGQAEFESALGVRGMSDMDRHSDYSGRLKAKGVPSAYDRSQIGDVAVGVLGHVYEYVSKNLGLDSFARDRLADALLRYVDRRGSPASLTSSDLWQVSQGLAVIRSAQGSINLHEKLRHLTEEILLTDLH